MSRPRVGAGAGLACHILDHAEGGLMGTVRVGDKAAEHTHPKKP